MNTRKKNKIISYFEIEISHRDTLNAENSVDFQLRHWFQLHAWGRASDNSETELEHGMRLIFN